MKMKLFFLACLCMSISICFSQKDGPWESPLNIAWSTDGVNFDTPSVFLDSAGVPSVIHWKGDTLIATFQWFKLPNPSPTWDQVATKASYDNGLTWTEPTPVNFVDLPANYQRPFDPTLVVFDNDTLRMYFSSTEEGVPPMGVDSVINTYSAKSVDGVNFYFEPGTRVDEVHSKVIDPAVTFFDGLWHYTAPIAGSDNGAHHYSSIDGLNFIAEPDIPSDISHNWTGNLNVESETELRFYGGGQYIWYNSTSTPNIWQLYNNTNLVGGDPSVLKISENNYLVIYVGPRYDGVEEFELSSNLEIYPNPTKSIIILDCPNGYQILDASGKLIRYDNCNTQNINIEDLPTGIYFIKCEEKIGRFVKN